MLVTCGEGEVEAPEEILALSAPRTRYANFLSSSAREVLIEVSRSETSPPGGTPLGEPYPPTAMVRLDGNHLQGYIADEALAAEAVLRIAWQVAVHRGGGLLMHGCSFHWNGLGVAAIGQSGAGKSTLARLSRLHPAHASLLSDEIVHLMPDGVVYGTPFRSDPDNEGSPGPARLRGLLLLAHGQQESLEAVSAAEALPVLFGQLYVPVIPVVPSGELRRRLMTLVDTVGVYRLTFRKDPAVGTFLRDWVSK